MIQIRPTIIINEEIKKAYICLYVDGEVDYAYYDYEAYHKSTIQIMDDMVDRIVKLYDAIDNGVTVRFTDKRTQNLLQEVLEIRGIRIHHKNL